MPKRVVPSEKLSVMVPKPLLKRFKIASIEQDKTIKEAVREAVEQWLKNS